jgi:hypothetical protein
MTHPPLPGSIHDFDRAFDVITRRDWAFVAACIAGAVLLGVWSFRSGLEFRRTQSGATDLSSARRHGGDGAPETLAPRGAEQLKDGR